MEVWFYPDFSRRTKFMIGFDLKNSFSIKGCYGTMCRLFPCIPILRSFFFLKRYHGMRVQGFTMILS